MQSKISSSQNISHNRDSSQFPFQNSMIEKEKLQSCSKASHSKDNQLFPECSTRQDWIEQQYFHMDSIDEDGQRVKAWVKFDSLTEDLLTDRSNNEFNFVFNYKVFFDYAFYHTLFYLFVGPFSALILGCWKGRHLVKNLHFFNVSYTYIQQLTFWLMFFTAMVFYSFQKHSGIYLTEIIVLLVSIGIFSIKNTALRITSISCKYATLPQSEIFLQLDKTFTSEEILSKQYVNAWQNQTNRIVYAQINNCIRRNEFDEQLFFIQFIQSPSAHMLNQLSLCNQLIQKANNSQSKVYVEPVSFLSLMMKSAILNDEDHPIVNGYGILKYLLDYYQRKNGILRKGMIAITFIISFFKSLLPMYFRYADNIAILGESNYDAVAIIFIAILQFMYYCVFQAFIVYGIYDLYRLVILQVQMCYLIMPKKQHFKYEFTCIKHVPTLNIFNALNMNAWIIMRKVSIEYGQDYFLRIQMLYSFTFVYILIYSLITIFEVVGVFRIDQIFGRIVLVELIHLGIEILIVVYLCARINEFFQIHQDLICENKEIVQDLYSLRQDYFQERKQIINFVHKIGVDFIQNLCNGDKKLIKNHLEQLIDCYDDMLLYLKTQSQTQPFTIVGFKIDKTFLKSIFAAFISIVGSLVQLNSKKAVVG